MPCKPNIRFNIVIPYVQYGAIANYNITGRGQRIWFLWQVLLHNSEKQQ